jgi:triosephosphate isomerase (TIM)
MPRRKLIAANWKMNKSISEAAAFAAEVRSAVAGIRACDLVIFPSFFGLRAVADSLAGTTVGVGAQDVFWETNGAYTGEVSAAMLEDAGAQWVLVGHSERRHVVGESNDVVARKFAAALAGGLKPILCVGETLAERDAGSQTRAVEAQLDSAFAARSAGEAARTVLAYEPVWAIGTGRMATPADAEEMHRTIRGWLRNRFDPDVAAGMRVQYGGSVKPESARTLLERDEIDGLLVGGASLDAGSFLAIARAAG